MGCGAQLRLGIDGFTRVGSRANRRISRWLSQGVLWKFEPAAGQGFALSRAGGGGQLPPVWLSYLMYSGRGELIGGR
nr:hypothetical protein CFP56_21152 [Quercus suber]